jgi:polysaccharide pyruvyl transferase WcaK-like protein
MRKRKSYPLVQNRGGQPSACLCLLLERPKESAFVSSVIPVGLPLVMRLHAAVLASSFGCPSVLMPCDQKIREYGDLMNLRRILEPATLDQASAVQTVLDAAWQDSGHARDTGRARSAFDLWKTLSLEQQRG